MKKTRGTQRTKDLHHGNCRLSVTTVFDNNNNFHLTAADRRQEDNDHTTDSIVQDESRQATQQHRRPQDHAHHLVDAVNTCSDVTVTTINKQVMSTCTYCRQQPSDLILQNYCLPYGHGTAHTHTSLLICIQLDRSIGQ